METEADSGGWAWHDMHRMRCDLSDLKMRRRPKQVIPNGAGLFLLHRMRQMLSKSMQD